MENKNSLGLSVDDTQDPIIKKQYSIDIETYKMGFSIFQRLFARKRNIIFTVLLSLVCANSIYQMITYPDYTSTCILMIIVCVLLIFVIWNNARLLKKNFGKSLDDIKGDIERDVYEFKLFDSYLTISSEIYVSDEDKKVLREQMETEEAYEKELEDYIHPPQTIMNLLTDNVKIIENESMFLIYEKKTVFYVIPKKIFNDEEYKLTREIFKKNLDKLFKDITKNKE